MCIRDSFEEVQEILRATQVPFRLNGRLVRGLDYYKMCIRDRSSFLPAL